MIDIRKATVMGSLLLFGAAGCADLVVTNQNDADADRALATAGDVESLISPAYFTWWYGGTSTDGPAMFLSVQSYQHSAYPANFAMNHYSRLPREAIANNPADGDYNYVFYTWYENYAALAGIADGLTSIAEEEGIAETLGPDRVLRATAFAKFMQGLSHGSIALLYDQGYVIDENVQRFDEAGVAIPLETVPYNEMMAAAIGYLDEAIALSEGADFVIPASWMTVEVPADELVRRANSWKARFLANVARTPEERAAVDWDAVLVAVDNGITADREIEAVDRIFWDAIQYMVYQSWSQVSYQILGMADQSGKYQAWINTEPSDRHPEQTLGGNFLIVTPDTRFAQGTTLDEQTANPGTLYEIPPFSPSDGWNRPDRGTYRWSWYWHKAYHNYYYLYGEDTSLKFMLMDEMNMLAAEAHYRNGNLGAAADLINLTRTAAGLNATDAAGTNTSCVPKLPSGECGDLWEMLKWEKRIETQFAGPMGMGWYLDGRGWGELLAGTQLHFPMPAQELVLFGLPVYTFGGDSPTGTSTGSIYEWPYENN
ncbi:MAG TPA: hypothetical protein VFI91_11745 [Longimicrobiaceae bacterium]|nr:hypothetical protein [Longimicrobiaceae bacterium]